MPSAARRSRLPRYVAAFLLGAAVLATALWLVLPALIERRLLQKLDAAGFADAGLEVAAVGLDEVRIVNARLDGKDGLTAAEVVAAYDLDGFMSVRVTRVSIRDLRVSGFLDSGRLSIGGLPPEASGSGRFVDASFLRSMPPILVEAGRIELATAIGPVTLPFQGTASPAPDGTVEAAITWQLQSTVAEARGVLDVSLTENSVGADMRVESGKAGFAETSSSAFSGEARLEWKASEPPRLTADFRLADSAVADIAFPTGSLRIATTASEWSARLLLTGADHTSDLSADLTLSDHHGEPRLSAAGKLTAAGGAWIWPLLNLQQPAGGNAQVEFQVAGPIPDTNLSGVAVTKPGDLLRLLAVGRLEGTAGIVLDQLAWPDVAEIASAAGAVGIRTGNGTVTIVPQSDIRVVASIAPTLIRSLDLPSALPAGLEGPWMASMTLAQPLQLVIDETGTTAGADFALQLTSETGTRLDLGFKGETRLSEELRVVATAGRLKVDGTLAEMSAWRMKAAGVDLNLDAALAMADDQLSIRIVEPGRVTARQLAGPPLAGTMKALALPLLAGEAPLLAVDLRENGSPRVSYDLLVGPVKARAALLLGGPKPVTVAVTLLRTMWTGIWSEEGGYSGAIRLTDGTLSVPSLEAAASGVAAEIALGTGRLSADLRAARIAHSGSPTMVVGLALVGQAELVADRLSFAAGLNDRSRRVKLSIEGEHRLSTGKGEVRLAMPPLAFKPGGLQPRDVVPAIAADIEEVSGRAAVGGRVSWSGGRLTPNLQLLLEDLSFRSSRFDVLHLNGVAEIDGLVPFTTRPGQQLSAALLNVGLPLTDIVAAFRIEPGWRLTVESARLSLAGGEVAVPPVTLDLIRPRTDLVLTVSDVDLSKLLDLAEVDGLAATGNLSGRIPMTFDENGPAIRDAVLAATGPGNLRYVPASAPSALLGGGENVALALQALSNFQYSDLTLTVNRGASGETVALMQVKGRNPDFYGGHPVELNLNVSGKLDQILSRGLAGYRIPDTIRERLGDFAQ